MHYIIIGILIGIIILIQSGVFLNTLRKITLFKSIFPDSGKFSTSRVFLSDEIIRELDIAEIGRNISQYKNVPPDEHPNMLTVRINGIEEIIHSGELETRVDEEMAKQAEILMKNNNQSYYVKFENIKAMQRQGWSFDEQKPGYHEITLISTTSKKNPVLGKILTYINTYLIRNKGAVSDFNLVKDIVERNCDAVDEEINAQIPIPLYLGLIGTMLGIVIGVGYMALIGFDSLMNFQNGGGNNGIIVLMGGVGIAMISSFIGLTYTTITSGIFYKGAKSVIESLKNEFYTFIQTDLLPTISSSASNSIATLKSNLDKFNEEFSVNVRRFDVILSQIHTSFENQTSIISDLKEIDFNKLAETNINVFQELTRSTNEISKFNDYLKQINTLIEKATTLNEKLQGDLDDIENRKKVVSKAFLTVNDSFEKGLKTLKENADERLEEVKKAAGKMQDEFEKFLEKNKSEISEIVINEKTGLQEHLVQNREVLAELKKHSELRTSIEKVEKAISVQNKIIGSHYKNLVHFSRTAEDLKYTVKSLANMDSSRIEKRLGFSRPLILALYVFIISGAVIGLGFIAYKLYNWIEKLLFYLF